MRDMAGRRRRERRSAEGNTRKPAVLGIVPIRQGRRPVWSLIQAGQNPYRLAPTQKRKALRESDRPTGMIVSSSFRERGAGAKGSVRSASLPLSMSPLQTRGTERALENESRGQPQMPNQRTNPHHHQEKGLKGVLNPQTAMTPEGELIALAKAKGQPLAVHTLRTIKESLELQGVTLDEFIEWARPHLQRGIFNPSGFLISRARNFRMLSSPASPPMPPTSGSPPGTADRCDVCRGDRLVLQSDGIVPCPKCSTPESRKEWERKEAERMQRAKGVRETGDNELQPMSVDIMKRVDSGT
jgi:hypothetical protein